MIDSQGQQVGGSLEEFLGRDAARGGPFALLGLRYTPIDNDMILRACTFRLSQLSNHSRSHTAAADEVRLAIHSAGSQLLDSSLRTELAKHWPEGSGETVESEQTPKAWLVDQGAELPKQIREQALAVLGASGGWNPRSRKRLGHFARMNKISAAHLVSGILGDKAVSEIDAPITSEPEKRSLPVSIRLHAGADAMPWILIPLFYALMIVALTYTAYESYQEHVSSQQLTPTDRVESGSAVPSPASSTRGENTRDAEERRHYSSIVFELDSFARQGISSMDEAIAFNKLGQRLGRQWTEIPLDDLVASVTSVDTVISKIINAEYYETVTEFLKQRVGQADEPVVFHAIRYSVFNRNSVISYSDFVRLAGGADADFTSHLERAFSERVAMSTDEPAWWDWWAGQVEAYKSNIADEQVGELHILNAAYTRLIEPISTSDWNLCTQRIVKHVQWGERTPSRIWLMGLLRDSEVRSDRLALLTRSIVTFSSARGMGVDMILQSDATQDEREDYLGRLKDRWATGTAEVDDVRAMLLDRLDLLIETTRNVGPGVESLNRSIELARVNTACFARFSSNEALLYQAIGELNETIEFSNGDSVSIDLSSSSFDQEWASKALNAGTSEQVSDLISELNRTDTIGPKSAHSLVLLMMRAPDLNARAIAERALLARRDSQAVLIALDRVLKNRASQRMLDFMNEYFESGDNESDIVQIRHQVQKKMIELGLTDLNGVAAGNIDEIHKLWKNTIGVRFESNSATTSIKKLYEWQLVQYIRNNESVPQQIIADLRLRIVQSRGPIHHFYAYQHASMELFALNISRLNPALRIPIRKVMDQYELDMQSSQTIYQQVMECERALSLIWKQILEFEGVSR